MILMTTVIYKTALSYLMGLHDLFPEGPAGANVEKSSSGGIVHRGFYARIGRYYFLLL